MIHCLEISEKKTKKKNKIYMTKQQRNIRERWVIFNRIIHDYNY